MIIIDDLYLIPVPIPMELWMPVKKRHGKKNKNKIIEAN